MLIGEILAAEGGKPIRFAAIGSCRLYEPLASLQIDGPVKVLWSKANAFTYGIEEALQYLRFYKSELDLPHDLWPLAFNIVPERSFLHEVAALLPSIDLFIVEVSSLASVRSRDYFLNYNIVGTSFIRGKGAKYVSWWNRVATGKPTADKVDEIIADVAAAGERLPEWHEILLREGSLTYLDGAEFSRAVGALDDEIDAKWMLVNIFVTPDDETKVMSDRRQLKAMMDGAPASANRLVYDPSAVVAAAGASALAGNGADKYHYAPEFRPTMGRALVDAARQFAAR